MMISADSNNNLKHQTNKENIRSTLAVQNEWSKNYKND